MAMRYNFLLLLLAFKTTRSLIFIINNKNEPKIIVPSQFSSIKQNSSKKRNYGNDTDVRIIVTPPTRPPVSFMLDFVF